MPAISKSDIDVLSSINVFLGCQCASPETSLINEN